MDKEERDAIEAKKSEQKRLTQLTRGSHTGAAVTGLAVDSVNKTLISVGSDAKLILWNFATHAPHKKSPYTLPSPATKLCHVRDSDLAAIAMEDFTVVLFDCATLSIVRRFGVGGEAVRHSGPISDLGFSPDGRSLFSSSLDGSIRVWDVPTNTCVDWLGFHTPPTSLTVSPTGEFLATTHIGKIGISLWSDRTFYQTVHMDGAHPPTEPAQMDDPVPIAETSEGDVEDIRSRLAPKTFASALVDDDDGDSKSKSPPIAKENGIITLSGMPPAHWKNLFYLELVKERNKPKEAPKKPPTAPFFLQWRGGESLGSETSRKEATRQILEDKTEEEEWDAVWSDDDDGMNADGAVKKRGIQADEENLMSGAILSKPKRQKVTHHRSHLAALLEECYQRSGDSRFQSVTDHVASLGPSAIDVSLSTLCTGMHDLEEGLPLLHMVSLWLLEACQSRQRYEVINAYLHRFLYLHANVLAGIDSTQRVEMTDEERDSKDRLHELRKEVLTTITLLKEAQQSASDALRGKMQHTLCLVRHFSRMV
jgi:U3 small nucleolar RNA-associated protein 21